MNAGTMISFTAARLIASFACSEAQTLTQRQTMAHEEPKLADQAQTASQICGTTITASFDWNSFVTADKVEDISGAFRNPPSNMCSVPLQVLQSMCQDPLGKQAIAAKIKSYECVYQDGPAPAVSLDSAGKLQYQSSFDAYHNPPPPNSTPGDLVKDWLGKHL